MKRPKVIIWRDHLGEEHVYLFEKKNGIHYQNIESVAYWLRANKQVTNVRVREIEPVRNEHTSILIKALEPIPITAKKVLDLMRVTEHDWK